MATIKDIAKNLDLSFSTVSRALNNHPAIFEKDEATSGSGGVKIKLCL